MSLKLKEMLPRFGLTQSALAKELGLSSAAIAQMLNHDIWPKNRERTALRNGIEALLKTNGATPSDLHGLFRKVTTGCEPEIPTQEDNGMLLRKQTLLPSARKHCGVWRYSHAGLSEQKTWPKRKEDIQKGKKTTQGD